MMLIMAIALDYSITAISLIMITVCTYVRFKTLNYFFFKKSKTKLTEQKLNRQTIKFLAPGDTGSLVCCGSSWFWSHSNMC